MRCTGCSQNIRPVVAVDIDGTLGDYHSHFTDFCYLYFGWERDRLLDVPWNGFSNFEDWLGLDRVKYREAKLAYRQGGNKRWLPLYEDAPEVMAGIRQSGAEIWIATTRPWQRLDNIDPDTQEWLRRHGIPYDHMLYGDDKYAQLISCVDPERIVAVIEDLPEQWERAKGLNLPVILRANHHNQATGTKITPQGTLVACGLWAVENVLEWRTQHERRIGTYDIS
jgi:hypothetical protein